MPIRQLPIDEIRTDGGTQPRAESDNEIIDTYVSEMNDGAEFPACVVFFDGDSYWLADGFHRFWASAEIGYETILCDVRKGTLRDAVLHSYGANATHGFRRTNSDKRRAVAAMLGDEEWSEKSSREIAVICGVSHTFVDESRKEQGGNVATLKTKDADTVDNKPSKSSNAGQERGSGESRKTGDSDGEAKPSAPELPGPLRRHADFKEIQNAITAVKKTVRALASEPIGKRIHVQRVVADLSNAFRAIKFAAPYSTCCYCGGSDAKCKACDGDGWIPKLTYTNAPKDMQDAATTISD